MAIYKLSLDDEMDKDILDFINSFPRMRKSEVVRQAIREYMSKAEGGTVATLPPNPRIQAGNLVQTKESNIEKAVTEEEIKPKKNRFAKVNDDLGLVETGEKPVSMENIY